MDGTTIDDAEDLDLVMLIYNLTEQSSYYSDTVCILWFYSKGEATNFNANITNTDVFKSLNYKAKLIRNTFPRPAPKAEKGILENAIISLSVKYQSNIC